MTADDASQEPAQDAVGVESEATTAAIDPSRDARSEAETADALEDPFAHLEDGRTRCSWVRGRPEHYEFHDAEYGRLPDAEEPTFELVLLTCFRRNVPLTDVLDRRRDLYEATAQWNMEAVAGAEDDALESLAELGGIFASKERLRWLRDVARACLEIAKEFKGLREYFLVFPGLTPEEGLDDVVARLPGFTKEDAASLLEMTGSVAGSRWELAHERDCWIA